MLTVLLTPLAVRATHALATAGDPREINPLLGATGRLLVLWAVVFSIGWGV
jgi:1,4-dihydroxy-2-naphthoate octaprenyltransferase